MKRQPSARIENDVAHEVLRTLRQILRRVSQHSRAMLHVAGLTVPQLMSLKAIGELEEHETEVTVAMVARRVQLSAATVSRIVDRLANAGLVLRERRSKDRRKACLSLTPAGLDRFHTLPTPLQERFVERLMELPESTRVELLDALRRITLLMEAEDIDAAPLLVSEDDVKNEPDPLS